VPSGATVREVSRVTALGQHKYKSITIGFDVEINDVEIADLEKKVEIQANWRFKTLCNVRQEQGRRSSKME
jgi:hypothetical protein